MAGDEILAVNDIGVQEVENAVEDLREALEGKCLAFGSCYPFLYFEYNMGFCLFNYHFVVNLDPSITLLLRSCRDEPPVVNKVTSDAIISSLVVQPPPKIR